MKCMIHLSCIAIINTEYVGHTLKRGKKPCQWNIFIEAQLYVLMDGHSPSSLFWLSHVTNNLKVSICLMYTLTAFQLARRYYLQYVSYYLIESFDTLLWEWKIFGKINCVSSFSSCSITTSLFYYYCFSAPLTDKPPKLLYPMESKMTIQETQLGE